MKRWKATVEYRTNAGTTKSSFEFDEFEELADVMERGPCWSIVVNIILQSLPADPDCPLTLEEEAEQQKAVGVRLQ